MNKGITGNKMLAHLDRVFGDHKPITADIFLDNYCNNKCPYCTYRRWEFDDGARYMKFEDFKRYADRLIDLGVLGFILTGGGEPTISKDFEKIVSWLDDNSLHYGINTNFNHYVQFAPDYLKVSLDGWDEDSYERIRGVRHYEQVRNNIKKFVEHKSDHTNVGIQLLAKNVSDVYLFYSANKDLPIDYMVIRPVESTDGQYYENLYNPMEPDRFFDGSPKSIINAIKDIAQKDSRVVLNYKWNFLGYKFTSCIGQWAQIAINELGEVMYCCHKPYQIVGHIMDDDILEKKRLAANDMKMCDVPCRLTGPNHDILNLYNPVKNSQFI